jgi:hypothetical protein
MRQTELRLAMNDRRAIEATRSKGWHMAREVNRACILAALGRRLPEAQIMKVLGVRRTMIWRTRAAYLEGGSGHAVVDMQRPDKPRRYQTEVEARITALACSPTAVSHCRCGRAVQRDRTTNRCAGVPAISSWRSNPRANGAASS